MRNIPFFFLLLSLFSLDLSALSRSEQDTNLKWFLRYRIAETDTDKDGQISHAEAKADALNYWTFYRDLTNFNRADRDQSKTLSFDELKAFRYKEEAASLQKQADIYDEFVEDYSKDKISDVDWLMKNREVANSLMSNYEWLTANQASFTGISKSTWLSKNEALLDNIAANYFLILRKPQLGKMLSTRYPKHATRFVKEFGNYARSKQVVRNAKFNERRPSAAEVDRARKAPKRSLDR